LYFADRIEPELCRNTVVHELDDPRSSRYRLFGRFGHQPLLRFFGLVYEWRRVSLRRELFGGKADPSAIHLVVL
jgi:hypothetical protein